MVNNFVDQLLLLDPAAQVIVLGDLNDFQFSPPLSVLKGPEPVLYNLYDRLEENERYSYIFEGNSQALDHILVSSALWKYSQFEVVHINTYLSSSHPERSSDHNSILARLDFPLQVFLPIVFR